MLPTGSDAIVVGAGTAGSVVAGRLAEAGMRVTVLEAGPDYGPPDSGRWPEDLLRVSASLPAGHDWGYAGRGAGGQDLVFERARCRWLLGTQWLRSERRVARRLRQLGRRRDYRLVGR
jgi:choline dehydrogenase-like flavoprotein